MQLTRREIAGTREQKIEQAAARTFLSGGCMHYIPDDANRDRQVKIQAAVLERPGSEFPYARSRPLVVQEVDLEGPQIGEVLIKVGAAGVCHSDLSVVDGNRPRPVPMVLGHEASGTVLETGAGVNDLTVGDHVVAVFVPSCGHCAPCSEGRPALCEPAALHSGAGELLSGERRLSRGGRVLHHHLGVSAFADHAVVSRRSLVKIAPEIPFEVAALFGCAVLTGVGSVINTGSVKPGSVLAIVGLGGVGLGAVLGAVVAGAERIVAVDLLDDKLVFARRIGATDTYNSSDERVIADIRDATGGGVDVAIEMAGSTKALELAYAITRRGGTTITGGLPNPKAMMQLQAASLVAEERTLKGSYIGTSVPTRDIPRLLALHARGRLPVDRLVTHRLPLGEINVALDRLRTGQAIRQLITFD
jgi:alcohol dehydrogenase